MHIAPSQQLGYGPRFARERQAALAGDTGARVAGAGRRYALAGDARPGDVLALAGGALMYDRNENGLIDGADARLVATARAEPVNARLDAPAPSTRAGGLDLLAGIDVGGARRGALVDVRG